MRHVNKGAKIAKAAHDDLTTQGQKMNEANMNETERENETTKDKDEVSKKKKNHSSALFAASMWRSPTGHSLSHVNRDLRGLSNLANTGPFVSYT